MGSPLIENDALFVKPSPLASIETPRRNSSIVPVQDPDPPFPLDVQAEDVPYL